LIVKKWFVLGAAVAAILFSGPAARAEVFPIVTLINSVDPFHPFNQALLYIKREPISPTKWLWTYDLDNLKDTGATKAPLRRFFVSIDPLSAGADWQSHVWTSNSAHSANEVPNPFVPDGNANFIKPAILNSEDIEWNWDNGSATNKADDFLLGTMRFQFETDLPSVTFTPMEARGSKGPAAGIGASPATTPEPASMALLLGGVAPLALKRRRRGARAAAAG
jgi:hypothetical protein